MVGFEFDLHPSQSPVGLRHKCSNRRKEIEKLPKHFFPQSGLSAVENMQRLSQQLACLDGSVIFNLLPV